MDVTEVKSFGVQAVGMPGEFNFELAWMRAFRRDARYDVEQPEAVFMQMLDTLGMDEGELGQIFQLNRDYLYYEPDDWQNLKPIPAGMKKDSDLVEDVQMQYFEGNRYAANKPQDWNHGFDPIMNDGTNPR